MSAGSAVIYVVEDDRSFRKSVERLIRATGFKAVAFESADSFLSLSRIERPACLLLDVRLPGIDGLALQEKLIEKGISLPIIFMTLIGMLPCPVMKMIGRLLPFSMSSC